MTSTKSVTSYTVEELLYKQTSTSYEEVQIPKPSKSTDDIYHHPSLNKKRNKITFEIQTTDDELILDTDYPSTKRCKSEFNGKNSQKSNKKRKREAKKYKKKLKQIGTTHPEFELAYDLLLGIRTSTSTVTSSVMRSSLIPSMGDDAYSDSDDEDDQQIEKEFLDCKRYIFPSAGSTSTPSHR